jgi:CTP synthase
LHCQVPSSHIFTNPDVNHIYEVPLVLQNQRVVESIEETLSLPIREYMIFTLPTYSQSEKYSKIAIVGKYTENRDTYLSIHRALEHGAFANNRWINIEYLSSESSHNLDDYDGIVIPGGFGDRGVEGMIDIATYCRIHNKPLLGICLGMQIMCIASVRKTNPYCSSSEFVTDGIHNVVISIDELDHTQLGGTMKLGIKETRIIDKSSHAYQIYKTSYIHERHRHRYEVNPNFISTLENDGLMITGVDVHNRIDIIEDPSCHFYFGCQYHPEYMNSLKEPSKVFRYFLEKCMKPA